MDKIIERIEREAGAPGLVSILAERLSATDLQSVLLEVYRLRAGRMSPSAVFADYQSNRFARPSGVSPACLLRWETIALSHLPREFQPIALSPVAPLGTSSVVAKVDQDWAVATTRNTEVVSDSTNVLALECAVRRRELLRIGSKSSAPIHLAASHRLTRGQRFEDPNSFAHFGSFALCSASRDRGNLQFELSTLAVHIRFYLSALRAFAGPRVPIHLSVTVLRPDIRAELVEAQLFSPIGSEFEYVDCAFDEQRTSGRGYYVDLCFHIDATAASGERLQLVDGGSVNWTRQYLSNAKERLVISGIGSERLCSIFEDDGSA